MSHPQRKHNVNVSWQTDFIDSIDTGINGNDCSNQNTNEQLHDLLIPILSENTDFTSEIENPDIPQIESQISLPNFSPNMEAEQCPTESSLNIDLDAPITLRTRSRNDENVQLTPRYTKRKRIDLSSLCRCLKHNDIKLDPEIFMNVCFSLNVSPEIDLFASRAHHQLPQFFAPDDETLGNNCCLYDCSKFKTSLCEFAMEKLIYLILHHIFILRISAIIIIPYWLNMHWWSLYCIIIKLEFQLPEA